MLSGMSPEVGVGCDGRWEDVPVVAPGGFGAELEFLDPSRLSDFGAAGAR